MLRLSLCFATLALLAVPYDAQAGGLIRRLPEVGEYARYAYLDTPVPELPGHLGADGELVLKCVGSAEIDGQRYLWLEIDLTRRTFSPENGQVIATHDFITKVLVAEEDVLSHDCEIVRGWTKLDDELPNELSGGLATKLASEGPNLVRYSLPAALIGIEDEDLIEATTEIPIAGESRTFTSAVAGTRTALTAVPEQGLVVNKQRDWESVWWLEDDLAFGVAAWESRLTGTDTIQGQPNSHRHWATVFRLNFVESGTNTTSELPDHN